LEDERETAEKEFGENVKKQNKLYISPWRWGISGGGAGGGTGGAGFNLKTARGCWGGIQEKKNPPARGPTGGEKTRRATPAPGQK